MTWTYGRLTPRQREVLLAVAELGSQKAAADALGIRLQTVKTHITNALAAYSADSMAQLVSRAWQDCFAPPGESWTLA